MSELSTYISFLKEDGIKFTKSSPIEGESGEAMFKRLAKKQGFKALGFSQRDIVVKGIDGYCINKKSKKRYKVQVKSLKQTNNHILKYKKVIPDVVYAFVRIDLERVCLISGKDLLKNSRCFNKTGISSERSILLQRESNWSIFA